MSGTTTDISFTFTDPSGGTDVINLTVDTTLSNSTGAGPSEAVVGIGGSIDGAAITGEVGAGGTVVNNVDFTYDNAIFPTAGDGILSNTDGIDNDGLYFSVNGVDYNLFSQDGTFVLGDTGNYPDLVNLTLTSETNAPCFCAGTMILTARGEVAVETLAMGDLVTTDAGEQPIRWIGRRAVAARFADPLTAMPIRIRAGALDENVPARDVLLSPCHAVLVDGILAQAGALVNGTSIQRETAMPETFTYYHLELAGHALVTASGMAAETFIDNADRMGFDNWAEHETLFGDGGEIVEMGLPRAKSTRQLPSETRARLNARGDLLVVRDYALAS